MMQSNLLEQVKDDAVAQARGGDTRPQSSAASSDIGMGSLAFSNHMTRRDEDWNTIEPFVVDETPVDDALHYYL